MGLYFESPVNWQAILLIILKMFTHGLDCFISIVILSNLDPHAGFRRNFSNFSPMFNEQY